MFLHGQIETVVCAQILSRLGMSQLYREKLQ